jgi:hypothetical protein
MKLFRFNFNKTYGREYCFNILEVNSWCLIQSYFVIGVLGRYFPYLNITSGSGRLLGITFQIFQFGVTIEFLSRNWRK